MFRATIYTLRKFAQVFATLTLFHKSLRERTAVYRRRFVRASDPARRYCAHQLVAVSRPSRVHAAAGRVGQLLLSVLPSLVARRSSAALSQTTSGRTRRREGAARLRSEVRFSTHTHGQVDHRPINANLLTSTASDRALGTLSARITNASFCWIQRDLKIT